MGGSAPGEMDEPCDLAVHEGEVFVADTRSSGARLVALASGHRLALHRAALAQAGPSTGWPLHRVALAYGLGLALA